MKTPDELINELEAARQNRRRHYLIAEYLANRLEVSHGSHSALVLGGALGQSNIQAIARWVSTQVNSHSIGSSLLEDELPKLEADLIRVLQDRFSAP